MGLALAGWVRDDRGGRHPSGGRHLVGKGGNTAWLIEDICGVIVAMGDRGDGEEYVVLFGPEQRVDAAQAVVEEVARGAWSFSRRLKERKFPIG